MVVREAPVDLAVELGDFAAQPSIELRRQHSGNTVAAIDGDLHRPRQSHVASDALNVGVEHIRLAARSFARLHVAALGAIPKPLDVVAIERVAGDDHLQSVVVGRIVAAAHRHAAGAVQVERREVGDGRRTHADVDGVGACAHQSVDQRGRELRAGKASIAADGEGRRVALDAERAERLADGAHDRRGQALADDAADVVGAKDFSG